VKIGLVDAEIIGLTEIVKKLNIKKKTAAFYKPTFGYTLSCRVG